MNTHTFIKRSFFLIFGILAILALDFVLMQGSLPFTPKTDVAKAEEQRTRPSASVKNLPPIENLQVKSFAVTSQDSGGVYRTGVTTKASCVIKNTSTTLIRNFRSLIRTPTREITAVKTILLKPGETIILENEFKPESKGVMIIACRGDVDHVILESTENDNREVAVLYVQ